MTQDPYGQPQGSGYVVRGEAVPDDEANSTPPTEPMTRFQKVASALRGERTDPAIPVDPAAPDPNGTRPDASQAAATTIPNALAPEAGRAEDDADVADARAEDAGAEDAGAEDAGAVRSPDGGNRDQWDDEDEARPEDPASAAAAVAPGETAADAGAGAATEDPTATQPDLYGTTARGESDAAAAGAAAGPAAADPAAAGAVGMAGAAEPQTGGTHAGAPVQEGLRPGETDGALGDFSDLTYGSLLPDASEFKTRWQQVQFRFVDDPQGSVTEAADVVAQVTAKLEAAIQERQRAISERQRTLRSRWSEGKSTDTESLRETLLIYRAFLDQLTGPKMS